MSWSWLTAFLLHVGFIVGVGGAFFLCWMGRAQVGRGIALAGLGAGFAAAGLRFAVATESPNRVGASAWQAELSAAAPVLTLLILVVALLAVSLPAAAGRALSAAALVGVGLATAGLARPAGEIPDWLLAPVLAIHVVGVVIWAGALLPLAATLRTGGEAAHASLRRFSGVIHLVFMPMLASGMLLALLRLGHLEALWASAFGRILLVKVVLIVVLLVIAAMNRFRLTGPSLAGDARSVARLRAAILAEVALIAGILALVAIWRAF